MKKLIQCIAFLGFISVNAQGFRGYNQFSVEAAYGLSMPVSAVSEVSDDSYSSNAHVRLGVRYMLTEDWGVKGQFSIDRFKGDIEQTGTKYIGADVQAYYNLGQLFQIPLMTRERVGLLAHTGIGVGYLKSVQEDIRDRVGQYIIGLTPIFRVGDSVSIMLDFSYTFNLRQHFNFDGEFFSPDDTEYTVGSFFTPSIGISIYLGSESRHADWD